MRCDPGVRRSSRLRAMSSAEWRTVGGNACLQRRGLPPLRAFSTDSLKFERGRVAEPFRGVSRIGFPGDQIQHFDRRSRREIDVPEIDPEHVRIEGRFEEVRQVLQRVDEMFGSFGVLIPSGSDVLRITLNTEARAVRVSSVFGMALM